MNPYEKLRPITDVERCQCSGVKSLLLVDLFTENPIHCEECLEEIDPEVLQLDAREVDAIAEWHSAASALYRLWLLSGEYEEYAKARLKDPSGQINQEGMILAKMLSKKWPTRFWFFHDLDDGEPTHCPICHKELDMNVRRGTGCCHECRLQI